MEGMNKEELVAELRSLVNNTEGEFTPDTADKAVELRNAIEASNEPTNTEEVEVAAADSTDQIEETRAASPTVQIKNNMNTPKFSIGKAVKEAVSGNITGLEAEVIQESRNMAASNGINTTGSVVLDPEAIAAVTRAGDYQADGAGADAAGAFVGVDVSSPVYTLRPKSIFDKLGATRLTGLRGDVQLPVGAEASANNALTEIEAITSAGAGIQPKQMTPQRIASLMTVSGQLLKQSEVNVEAFLMGDLMRAMGEAQDAYLMVQLLDGLAISDASAAGLGLTAAEVIANMEDALDMAGANRDNAEFLTGDFKPFRTAAMVSGVNAISDARSILGYNTVVSSQAVDGSDKVAIMGDFSDFVIGEWGGLDLTVDPYSAAHTNQVRLIVNTHVDGTRRQDGNYKAYHSVGA